jgi:hypothetical protein
MGWFLQRFHKPSQTIHPSNGSMKISPWSHGYHSDTLPLSWEKSKDMASQWFHKENYQMVDFNGLKTCLSISNLCRVFRWRVASNRLTYVEKSPCIQDSPRMVIFQFAMLRKPRASLAISLAKASSHSHGLRSNYWTNPKRWQHEPCHGKRGVCLNMLVPGSLIVSITRAKYGKMIWLNRREVNWSQHLPRKNGSSKMAAYAKQTVYPKLAMKCDVLSSHFNKAPNLR